MPPHDVIDSLSLVELSATDLVEVTAGSWVGSAVDTAKQGLRTMYRWAVNEIAADVASWQVAKRLYGDSVSASDFLQMRGAISKVVRSRDKLPAWAPDW